MSVYDPSETIPSTEFSKVTPKSQYSFSKWLGEQACMIFKKNRPSCGLTILRLAQVYGPGSPPQLAIYSLIRQALDLMSIELRCGSGLVRDFIYLDDAIEAIGLAIQLSPEGIFNVNGGSPIAMGEVVSLIEEILGTSLCKKFGNSEDKSRALDMEKFKRVTGFKPLVSMKEGLMREIQRLKLKSDF
jgi:nucleoside-diphosphate-sugar epimerase